MGKRVYLIFFIFFTLPLFSQNSRINWIRAEYNRIEDAIKYGHLHKETKSYENDNIGAEATIYRDGYGRVRKYFLSKGSEDSAMSAEYYYDKRGRMFFSFLHYINIRKKHKDIRSYYDRYGLLIKRLVDSTTDIHIPYYYRIKNPEKHFRHFNTE